VEDAVEPTYNSFELLVGFFHTIELFVVLLYATQDFIQELLAIFVRVKVAELLQQHSKGRHLLLLSNLKENSQDEVFHEGSPLQHSMEVAIAHLNRNPDLGVIEVVVQVVGLLAEEQLVVVDQHLGLESEVALEEVIKLVQR